MKEPITPADHRSLPTEVLCLLDAEAAEWEAQGPLGAYDTTYSVPHQHEDTVVEFDLLTVTIDDIITQCGYPESARARLTEAHRRIAAHMLRHYKGPINGSISPIGGNHPRRRCLNLNPLGKLHRWL